MSIGTLVGQDRVGQLLRKMVEEDRLPHAVLFIGPEGSGKTAAALSLARALQCTSSRSEAPCESCGNCGRTRVLSHPDFSLLMPFLSKVGDDERRKHLEDAIVNPYSYGLPEASANISIDSIRDLIKSFGYGSYQGNWRTTVILHAHMMRVEAANAMLKTLEEPPKKSLLILTAPSLDSLLPTIVSRCQYFRLGPVPTPTLSAYLMAQRGANQENAAFLSELAGGNVRQALTIASDEAHQTQDRALKFLNALMTGREAQTFLALEQLAGQKADVFDVLKSSEVWLRDVLQLKLAGPERVVNRHRIADVEGLANGMTERTIQTLVEEIERVREMNHRNINLQLSLTELWQKARKTVTMERV